MARTKKREIRPDPKNANRGTERGTYMIEESLRRYGAGRSIVIDGDEEDPQVIVGNHVYEIARRLGIPIREIETDGAELIAIKRTDLDLDSEEDLRGRMLSFADNRTGQVNLNLAYDMIAAEQEKAPDEVGAFWFPEEIEGGIARGAGAAMGFLDDYANAETDDSEGAGEAGPRSNVGGPNRGLPAMAFQLTADERADVLAAISKARDKWGDQPMSTLLALICGEWT